MINVIGIGQNRENMTLGALKAIEESDVIIGYKKYVDQISDLISDKEIIKKGMGDEIARAEMAIQKSLDGQTVSLISSGDPGVFGMANVVYQIVSKYEGVEIKVYPGVSALNYASSKLGAPLNDFAAISLSNILTPLSEIEKKLRYALEANLIVAIYNPLSKTRKEPFNRFKKCVTEIKGEDALIGIIDSTYEPAKKTIVKVKDLTEDDISKLREYIDHNLQVEGDRRRAVAFDIKRLIEIGSYRGVRHRKNLPVRGQRSKTNARTRKGPRKTMANKKK